MYLTVNANSFGAVSAEGGLCKRAQPKASDLRENEVFCLVLNRQRERLWCCVCGRVVCANERSQKASDLRENEVFCLVLNRQREQLWYFLRKYNLAKLEYQSYNKGTF